MADTSRPAPARNHDRAAALADAIVWVFRDTFTAWFRGDTVDVREARAAIDLLASIPTDPGFVMNEIWLLRLEALLAQSSGDDSRYRDYRDRYRKRATELGFEGHKAMAEAMP